MYKLFILIPFLFHLSLSAQDSTFARNMIKTLTSEKFSGRGYVNHGVDKAADFLEETFKSYGLKPLNQKSYSQFFTSSMNTFPGKMKVKVDGKQLVPGVHYIVAPESKALKGSFTFHKRDSVTYEADQLPVIISLQKKLTWSVATGQADYTVIELLKDSFPKTIQQLDINIEAKLISAYKLRNICGYIPGSEKPDSFIVFSAHYDHLGNMGAKTIFPGANDNASGTAMLLSMMKYYSMPEHKPKCSIAFISFAAEEAGLLGSAYFVNNPLIPLTKIKFLINLDLLGTGDEGITVVNATEFKKEFNSLKELNEKNKYLPLIKPRGKAKNSDHYWFSEKGVPCFFIYTMGGIKAYHDVYDIERTLPLTKFKEVFYLLRDFSGRLME